jgi:hypothetical protein
VSHRDRDILVRRVTDWLAGKLTMWQESSPCGVGLLTDMRTAPGRPFRFIRLASTSTFTSTWPKSLGIR